MNTTRNRSATVAVAAALLLLAGCSSGPSVDTDVHSSTPSPTPEEEAEVTAAASESPSPPPTEEPEPEPEITIAEVGFVPGGEWNMPMAYAVVENPSDNAVWAQIDFTAYDADDAVLTNEMGFIPLMRAGQTVPAVTDLFAPEGTTVDHVEAVITSVDSQLDESPGSQMHGANLNVFDDGYGMITLTGVIESDYINSYDQVEVVALCRDGDEVTGAGYTYVDRFVTPDTPGPFEVMLTGTGTPETCEVLASPGFGSTERTPDEA